MRFVYALANGGIAEALEDKAIAQSRCRPSGHITGSTKERQVQETSEHKRRCKGNARSHKGAYFESSSSSALSNEQLAAPILGAMSRIGAAGSKWKSLQCDVP